MTQRSRWLPCRLRRWLDQRRILNALRRLDATRPCPGADPHRADAEVHMLLCRRDLELGVLALKSLLRFEPDRLAVMISDDGTLSPSNRLWVQRHIPNCGWLTWPARGPAIERAITTRPATAGLYRGGRFPLICKVLHPIAAARCEDVIVLDPDTAFFAPPQQLLQWVRGREPAPLYMHDHQDEVVTVMPQLRRSFNELLPQVTGRDRSYELAYWLFNSGLLAFEPAQLDLDIAERYFQWSKSHVYSDRRDRMGIWFGHWTREQTAYQFMFAAVEPAPKPFGDEYFLGGGSGYVFNHFLRHYLVRDETLNQLRQLIGELAR